MAEPAEVQRVAATVQAVADPGSQHVVAADDAGPVGSPTPRHFPDLRSPEEVLVLPIRSSHPSRVSGRSWETHNRRLAD